MRPLVYLTSVSHTSFFIGGIYLIRGAWRVRVPGQMKRTMHNMINAQNQLFSSRRVPVLRLHPPLSGRGPLSSEQQPRRGHATTTSSEIAVRGLSCALTGRPTCRRCPPVPTHGRSGARSVFRSCARAHPAGKRGHSSRQTRPPCQMIGSRERGAA